MWSSVRRIAVVVAVFLLPLALLVLTLEVELARGLNPFANPERLKTRFGVITFISVLITSTVIRRFRFSMTLKDNSKSNSGLAEKSSDAKDISI
jgi:hypothetical protein